MHRRLTTRLLGAVVEPPRPRHRPLGALARLRTALSDTVAWRALLYLLLRLPLGVLGFAAAVLLPLGCCWLLGFPLWARLLEPGRSADRLDVVAVLLGVALAAAVPGAIRTASAAERRLARGLLGPARTEQRVTQLEHARATLSAANTDRLRRLEQDLHDGTQARLVALAITLSLADDALDPRRPPPRRRPAAHPARPRPHPDRRDHRRTAPPHPRHPPGRTRRRSRPGASRPRRHRPGTGRRPPRPAGTARPGDRGGRLLLRRRADHQRRQAQRRPHRRADGDRRGGRLRLTVRDDGRGGAAALAAPGARAGQGGAAHAGADGGTGLAGLRERLTAVDGSLHIASPQGGPTVVTAELPVSL
ncbi:sensor domain-containing protein [Kitasatospora aburaviensis]